MITSRSSRKSSGEGPSPARDPSYARTKPPRASARVVSPCNAPLRARRARARRARRIRVAPVRSNARATIQDPQSTRIVITRPSTRAARSRRLARLARRRAIASRTSRRCRFMLDMPSSARARRCGVESMRCAKPHASARAAHRDAAARRVSDATRTDARERRT
jgi:hypothetical protein